MPRRLTVSDAINAGKFDLTYDPQSDVYYDADGVTYYADGQFDRLAARPASPTATSPPVGAGRPGVNPAENLPQNPYELAAMMVGQNQQANRLTGSNVFGALAGNQLGGYLNYGGALDALFNQGPTSMKTPWGTVTTSGSPYSQLQEAATAQAPSNAARDIAQIQAAVDMDKNRSQRQIASQLMRSLFGATSGMRQSPGLTTDYGAGFNAQRPQHVNVNKFRPKSEAASLFA